LELHGASTHLGFCWILKSVRSPFLTSITQVYARLKRQDLVVLPQVLLFDHILFIMAKLLQYAYIPKRQEIA
jgi:hypothetical protein